MPAPDAPNAKPDEKEQERPAEQAEDEKEDEGADGDEGKPEPSAPQSDSLAAVMELLKQNQVEMAAMRESLNNLAHGQLTASLMAEGNSGEGTAAEGEVEAEYPDIDLESLAKTLGA